MSLKERRKEAILSCRYKEVMCSDLELLDEVSDEGVSDRDELAQSLVDEYKIDKKDALDVVDYWRRCRDVDPDRAWHESWVE